MDISNYFDYAAATPIDPLVSEAMGPYFSDRFFNPSALYIEARSVRHEVDAARSTVARAIGARPAEIIFTAGGTESNNLAVQGVMGQYPDANVVLSAIEHDSVYEPARLHDHKIVGVTNSGIIDIAQLSTAIDDQTVMVSIMYANNEIGTIQPLKEVAQIIAKVRQQRRLEGNTRPVFLHADACQASLYLDLNVARLGVDLMTINGGKMYGPKQVGVLYMRAGVSLAPLIRGGGQERGLRSGTENVAGIIGIATALDLAVRRRNEAVRYSHEMQRALHEALLDGVAGLIVNGSLQKRLPNNLNITIPGIDNERLMMELDERGMMVAVGSACSASANKPSRVLEAIGLSDELARSTVRITMGRFTTIDSVHLLARHIRALVAQ